MRVRFIDLSERADASNFVSRVSCGRLYREFGQIGTEGLGQPIFYWSGPVSVIRGVADSIPIKSPHAFSGERVSSVRMHESGLPVAVSTPRHRAGKPAVLRIIGVADHFYGLNNIDGRPRPRCPLSDRLCWRC